MKSYLKRAIAIGLCVISAISLFACADQSSGSSDTSASTPEVTTAPEQTTEPEVTTEPTATTEAQTTLPEETSISVPNAEPMKLDEGYSVTSEKTFKITGTEKKQKITLIARVATLKNESGERAFYLDILNDDGTVRDFQRWKGRGQIHINHKGEIYVFRINITSDLTDGFAYIKAYCISDIKTSVNNSETLERAEIVDVQMSIPNQKFALNNNAAIATSQRPLSTLFHRYDNVLLSAANEKDDYEGGKEFIYLILDSYSDANKDMTYSPDSKTPRIDLMINEVKDKFTVDYILDLFTK